MEVPRVQAEQLAAGNRVAEVELVRASHVGLRTEPEQLAFHRIEVAAGIQRLREHLIERLHQALARDLPVGRQVLVAVRNPHVRHAGRSQRLSEGRADLPAGSAVLDPEATHALVWVRESEPVFGKRMGEEGRVEVDAQAGLAGPIDPAREMLGPDFVAIDPQAAGLGVDCVEVDAVPAGD